MLECSETDKPLLLSIFGSKVNVPFESIDISGAMRPSGNF
jgi:hypothetical protein